jgi:hypothetical protein
VSRLGIGMRLEPSFLLSSEPTVARSCCGHQCPMDLNCLSCSRGTAPRLIYRSLETFGFVKQFRPGCAWRIAWCLSFRRTAALPEVVQLEQSRTASASDCVTIRQTKRTGRGRAPRIAVIIGPWSTRRRAGSQTRWGAMKSGGCPRDNSQALFATAGEKLMIPPIHPDH